MDEQAIRERMGRILEEVRQQISTIRTGRATPSLVKDLVISVYNGTQSLKLIELATITTPDSQTISIAPWDKSILEEIKKGIEEANIGLTPVIVGEEIHINLPPMTAERREKYIRMLHDFLEKGRVAVRMVRQEAMKEVAKAFHEKQISEDQKLIEEEKIQKITDEFVSKINQAGEAKEAELQALS